jgi:hypothetical protein
MDRFTPLTAEQVFWSSRIGRRDRAAGRLELCLSLMPKLLLQPVLAALEDIGAALQSAVQRMATTAGAELNSMEMLPAEQHGTYRRIGLRAATTPISAAFTIVAFRAAASGRSE